MLVLCMFGLYWLSRVLYLVRLLFCDRYLVFCWVIVSILCRLGRKLV